MTQCHRNTLYLTRGRNNETHLSGTLQHNRRQSKGSDERQIEKGCIEDLKDKKKLK